MASGQSVFKDAFGWDDWIWWVAIGCVALLILLLLICCCVCMQRAKRKGHEEALASVQTRQRLTQDRQQVEQQQQRYLQAQQPRNVTFATNNGSENGYQPAQGYSKQVTTAPLPNRKNLEPQVAANGYQEYPLQLHTHQFAKPYPGQQETQVTGHGQRYQGPRKWYNADHTQGRSPSNHGSDANVHINSQYPNSMRSNDPYPIGGGTNGVPFISVRSPLASKSSKPNRKNGARLQNQAALNLKKEKQIPAPVVVPTYTRSSPSLSKAPVSPGLESSTLGDTLQSRIEALRSGNADDVVHTQMSSFGSTGLPYSSSETGDALGTFPMLGISNAPDSYASIPAGRSGLFAGNMSALSNSLFSSPSSSLHSGRSFEMIDSEACENTKSATNSTMLGDALTHGSSRSIISDYSFGPLQDTGSYGPGDRDLKSRNSSNGYTTTSSRLDNVSFNSNGSVEF